MTVIDEIARRTGLSHPTIKQVLGTRAFRYRPETRDRIWAIARELGYRPNAAARATRTGRFDAVGLLLSVEYGRGRLVEPLFHALRESLRAKGLQLVVGDLPDEQLQSEEHLPRILREWSVDGLLINYTHEVPPGMRQLIERQNLPAVWLNTRASHDCVHPDDVGGGRVATRALLDRGHRRVAYLAGTHPVAHYSYRDRHAGYLREMKAAGLPPRVLGFRLPHEPAVSVTTEQIEALLSAPDRPTGFVCYGIDLGIQVLVASARLGLAVPRDVSLVVFHHDRAVAGDTSLATMALGAAAMAEWAISLLSDKIANPEHNATCKAVAFQLVEGATLAAPPPAGNGPRG